MKNIGENMGYRYLTYFCVTLCLITRVKSQCDASANELDLNILQHELSDNESKDLDLLVILDRSPSVADESGVAKSIIRRFLAFISLNCQVQFETDTDHVAFIPFGMQQSNATQYTQDGISNPALSDVCAYVSFLAAVPIAGDNLGSDTTSIITALQEADTIFSTSRSTEQKYQMLLVLYDGEVHSSYEVPDSGLTEADYDNDLNSAVQALKNDDVTIYAVAIGQWLDEDQELERVRSMATSDVQFACSDKWLNELMSGLDAEVGAGGGVYAESTECSPSCDVNTLCMCDVISTDTSCQDSSNLECPLNTPTESTSPSTPTSTSTTQPTTTTTQPTTTTTPTTPAPAPDTTASATTEDPTAEKSKKSSEQFYEKPVFYAAVGGGVAAILLVVMVIVCCCCCSCCAGAKKSEKEEVEFGSLQLEFNMDGWANHLATEAKEQNLIHLGVFDFTGQFWARTPRLFVEHGEINNIETMHSNAMDDIKASVTISDVMYVLSKKPADGRNVWFGRIVDDSQKHIVMWMKIVQQYVIIGVAVQDRSDICRKTVCGLGVFFQNKARASSVFQKNGDVENGGYGLRTSDINFSMDAAIFSELPDQEYFSYLEMQNNVEEP